MLSKINLLNCNKLKFRKSKKEGTSTFNTLCRSTLCLAYNKFLLSSELAVTGKHVDLQEFLKMSSTEKTSSIVRAEKRKSRELLDVEDAFKYLKDGTLKCSYRFYFLTRIFEVNHFNNDRWILGDTYICSEHWATVILDTPTHPMPFPSVANFTAKGIPDENIRGSKNQSYSKLPKTYKICFVYIFLHDFQSDLSNFAFWHKVQKILGHGT